MSPDPSFRVGGAGYARLDTPLVSSNSASLHLAMCNCKNICSFATQNGCPA